MINKVAIYVAGHNDNVCVVKYTERVKGRKMYERNYEQTGRENNLRESV